MYIFKEDSWLHNDVKDLWELAYIKKGNLFSKSAKSISKFSGVWVCKKEYSWDFAIYFDENLKKAKKKLKAKKFLK